MTPIRARANAHDRAAYQRRTIQQRQQEADSQRERASQEIARRQEEDRINEAASNTGPGDEATQEEDDQPINAQQLNLVQDEDDENTLTLEQVHVMSIHEILTRVANGETLPEGFRLEDHPFAVQTNLKFLEEIFDNTKDWYHCPCCKERGPHVKEATGPQARDDECANCLKSRKASGDLNCRPLSKANDMDPYPDGYCFGDIPTPTTMELQLVARGIAYFKAYRLTGNGDIAYKGNVCNFEQDLVMFVDQLPLRINQLPHCVVVRRGGNGASAAQCKDFKVRRNVVRSLIVTLQATFPDQYGDIVLNEENLNALPLNGSVLDQIPEILEGDEEEVDLQQQARQYSDNFLSHNDNPNGTNNNQTENQGQVETEDQQQLGPEQGGATGEAHLLLLQQMITALAQHSLGQCCHSNLPGPGLFGKHKDKQFKVKLYFILGIQKRSMDFLM